MLKTYTANSEICINVRMAKGVVHLNFIPQTLGKSSYATSDKALQEAIERHRLFGKRFTLAQNNDNDIPSPQEEATEKDASPKTLSFGTLADAKDYIADTWNISRTKLRTREQLEAAAAAHGVTIMVTSSSSDHDKIPHR